IYISAQEPHWRGGESAAQWRAPFANYVFPRIWNMGGGGIKGGHGFEKPDSVLKKEHEKAARLRAPIEGGFGWATARGQRPEDMANPAARRLVTMGLPKQPKKNGEHHHAAMPYAKLPAFMKSLKTRGTVAALALEFTILTSSRIGEVVNSKW